MATPAPLRFCLTLTHQAWARASDPALAVTRTTEIARVADAAGIDSIWVTEDPDGWDAFAVLGALARETGHVRLGTGVTNPYLRHPNLLAASTATLDVLSGGRAFLGLGRGQTEWSARGLGIEVANPLNVLRETFDLLRQWWMPPHRASSSGHFRVQDWERSLNPILSHPPIYLAAAGPRALDLAGRRADGVIFDDLSSDAYLTGAIARLRAAAVAAGRDPAGLICALRTRVVVTDDPAPHVERQKTIVALVHALPGMDRLLETPGFDVPAIMAEVRRRMRTDEILGRGGAFPALRREGDLAAARAAIPTELVAHLAIAGPLPAVRARLDRLRALGITHVFVAPPAQGESANGYAARLRGLG